MFIFSKILCLCHVTFFFCFVQIFHALFQYATHNVKELELGNVTSYLLKGLMGYTQYDIRVLAFTKIGDGRMSAALKPFPRTLETSE